MVWYLILQWCAAGYGANSCYPVIVPVPYTTEQACEDAGNAYKAKDRFVCIQHP